jgi:hypothetical protein
MNENGTILLKILYDSTKVNLDGCLFGVFELFLICYVCIEKKNMIKY